MMDLRKHLLGRIEQDRDMLVRFLSEFVAVPSPNPPGDTRAVAGFVRDHLARHGHEAEIVAPQPSMPNILCSLDTGRPGPHLVLNGHLDVFPAGEETLWSRPPWSGDVEDGRIWGRGVADMKCGTAASIQTFIYLAEILPSLCGRLTLTAVSDEETGGAWGTRWLLENMKDRLDADCVLNGEPSNPAAIRFAEKGTLRLTFEIATPGAHGAYTHLSRNAVREAARLIAALDALEAIEPAIPQEIAVHLARPEVRARMDEVMGEGAAEVATRVTVSIGTIHGGLKVNMLPGNCRFEADIRLPPGVERGQVLGAIETILEDFPEARMSVQEAASNPSSMSDPSHPMVEILRESALVVRGREPVPIPSLGATDCKFFRYHGIPSFIYGPPPTNMSRPDENVSIADWLDVLRVHALAAAGYLAAPSA
ncbi:ArgE/DapE family deacylase [Geminicoccaceae bacterium 1502E]|nr:ArgE/DapE family deacylase [Geminicoccaceae bacterium 1502E]